MGGFELQDFGLVGPLTKFPPKTVQHQFGHLFATRVLGDVFQGDSFLRLVPSEVLVLLLWGLAPPRPTCRLLLDLKPSVHIIRKQAHFGLFKVPHFMYPYEDVPPGHCFLEFGGTPRSSELALLVCVFAEGTAFEQRFGLFFSNAGHAERKGEFSTVADRKHGMKKMSGRYNSHQGQSKVRVQVLVFGFKIDLWVPQGVPGCLVDPGVQGRHIHVQDLLPWASLMVKSHGPGTSAKKKHRVVEVEE